MTEHALTTTCCVVGGGPAGAVLGLLLARAGVGVTVLEKHEEFLRDFRGDTIHASTLRVMRELGLYDRFSQLPRQVTTRLDVEVGTTQLTLADFSVLPGPDDHIWLMPQWDFLDFLTSEARQYPTFRLLMGVEATDLLWHQGRVNGVSFHQEGRTRTLEAGLTVACDGRDSTIQQRTDLALEDLGAPMDVLWFRLPRDERQDPPGTFARVGSGQLLGLIDRGDYWQAAYVIGKGSLPRLRSEGIEQLHQRLRQLADFLDEARLSQAVGDWEDLKLLRVQVNRCDAGTARGCCSWVTRPTPCHRSGGWGSTWPSKTRSLRQTCSLDHSNMAGSPTCIWRGSNGDEPSRPS